MIYDNIEKLCKEQKKSIRKVEIDCNLGNGTIRHWQGATPKTIRNMLKIAEYFDVTIDELVK